MSADDKRWAEASATSTWVGGALLVLIALMANYLAFRHYERWDWTRQGLFTLSERTEAVVRGLDQDVEIILFLSGGEPDFGDVSELLESYRGLSPRLSIRHVDPDRDPAEYRVLADRFGLLTLADESGNVAADVAAVVHAGDRRWKIARQDLIAFDFESVEDSDGPKIDVQTERALTGAILEVTEGEPTRVCVSSDHGEWGLAGAGERGLGGVREELERDNVEMESIQLGTVSLRDLRDRCDALWVVGPLRPLSEAEANHVGAYVREGGRALLAFDPILDRGEIGPTGFETVARSFGIDIDRSIVVDLDPARWLAGSPVEALLVGDYGEHPVTAALRRLNGPIVIRLARAVRATEGGGAVDLARGSERGYAERSIDDLQGEGELGPDESDLQGPVPIAVAREIERAEGELPGRLIVIGDADVFLGAFLQEARLANIEFLTAVAGWTTQRPALITIAPRRTNAQSVLMTEGDLGGVLFRVVVLLPLAALLLGVAVYWSRRS